MLKSSTNSTAIAAKGSIELLGLRVFMNIRGPRVFSAPYIHDATAQGSALRFIHTLHVYVFDLHIYMICSHVHVCI